MVDLKQDSYCFKITTALRAVPQMLLNYIIVGDLVSNLGLFMS